MTIRIQKVAVLGAGVMGQGIAAHLANAGIESVLFDIAPKDEGADPRAIAKAGIQTALKAKPAVFYKKDLASMVTPAVYGEDDGLLAQCDWIIEVVVEFLPVKKKVYQWVAEHRRPGSIVSSNTSGISLAEMAAGMPDEMAEHFCVTHFFNPVRYMRLLELVAGEKTRPEVVQAVADFGEKTLGKGIVHCKDTPNFIANRVGCYGIASVFKHMETFGMGVSAIDGIFGKPMGRPNSAVFRTADLVGLDTLDHVFKNVYDGAPHDEERDAFVTPAWIKAMIDAGILGEKTGAGFFKKSRDASGKREILARDPKTGEYGPSEKVRFASLGKAKNYEEATARLRIILQGDDDAAKIAWAVTADTLIYSANRIPEIADDIVNVDRAMKWGFAWEIGPFESWDAIGVADSVARMEADGRTVPAWVKDMLASGRGSFYAREAGRMTYWDPASKSAKPVPMSDDWLLLVDVKSDKDKVVHTSATASLLDIGDGVACLQFHGKMNAIDMDIIQTYKKALDELDEGKWEALVVGNQGGMAFCAGANLMMVGMAAMQQKWDELDDMILQLQMTLQRAKYSKRPVVTAPWGLALGGGCEVMMQSTHTQALGELYAGQVEVGVGVIPAGGGCKEMLARTLGDIPEGTDYDPNPFIQNIFKGMALATVATSAEEARAMGYLRPTDGLTLDPDALLSDAKKAALGLVQMGYKPPKPRKFKLPGASGRAAIEMFLYQMQEGGYATGHDVTVGKRLAYVLTGGDIPSNTWMTEEDIIHLEREGFMALAGTEKTQARIQHMLMKGKPLRN